MSDAFRLDKKKKCKISPATYSLRDNFFRFEKTTDFKTSPSSSKNNSFKNISTTHFSPQIQSGNTTTPKILHEYNLFDSMSAKEASKNSTTTFLTQKSKNSNLNLSSPSKIEMMRLFFPRSDRKKREDLDVSAFYQMQDQLKKYEKKNDRLEKSLSNQLNKLIQKKIPKTNKLLVCWNLKMKCNKLLII